MGNVLPLSRPGVAVARVAIRAAVAPLGTAPGTTVEPVREGEWVLTPGVARPADSAILYLHGSGYVACSPRTHRCLTSRLSALAGLPVFAPRYRLAPEHRFPCAADDVFAAYRYLLDRGLPAERIVVAGDSVGGHLALGLAVQAALDGVPATAALVLFSPLVDHTWRTSGPHDRVCRDPFMSRRLARRLTNLHLAGCDAADARLNLLGDATVRLPPILVQAGGVEMLCRDAERLGEVVEAAGGRCEVQVWPGQIHVFQGLHRFVPEAREALEAAAAFIADALTARPPANQAAAATLRRRRGARALGSTSSRRNDPV